MCFAVNAKLSNYPTIPKELTGRAMNPLKSLCLSLPKSKIAVWHWERFGLKFLTE